MSVGNPKNMRDMGVLRRIANKSGEKIVNIGEQLTDLDFLAELSVHSVGKLLGAFAAASPRSRTACIIASMVALGVGRLRQSFSSAHAASNETLSLIRRRKRA